jgi:hypothetical protein
VDYIDHEGFRLRKITKEEINDGHRGQYDEISPPAIFSAPDVNFIQIENHFSCAPVDVFVQILECSMKDHPKYLQMLLVLRDTLSLDSLVAGEKDK